MTCRNLIVIASLKNLRFQYDSAQAPVLDIPAWSIDVGERIFLEGPSGAGKSTLLNLLSGILLPSAGEIEVMGERLDLMTGGQRDRWRARHIGVVFQQFNLIPYLSPVDNIRLGAHFGPRQVTGGTAKHFLEALGIEAELFHVRTARLSIGQQQRVAIARALVNHPALLIADEPTSALDTHNRDRFMTLLLEQADLLGTAVLLVSHDRALAQFFPRVQSLPSLNRAALEPTCS